MQGANKLAGITFELEYPNAKLSPNARTHHMQKANITKKVRSDAKLIALSAGAGSLDKIGLQIRVTFYPATNRRRDEDNVIGAFKAYRDGIADALGVDDADVEFDYKLLKETRGGGATVVQINSDCKTCIKCGQYLQINKNQ